MEEIVVLQRQQGLVPDQYIAIPVHEVVKASAGLDTLSPVCASSGNRLGQIALAAVAHTEGSVHEELDFGACSFADFPDALQGHLPFQHNAGESQVSVKQCLVLVPNRTLC